MGLLEKLLPSAWTRLLIGAIALAAMLGLMFLKGALHERAKWEVRAARDEAVYLEGIVRAGRIADRVVYQYMDRWHIVAEKGKTIIREVPRYVTKEADAGCAIPLGFVWLHDAAASDASVLPPAPRDPDAIAPGLALSAVSATVGENYTTCKQTRAQLTALQAWAVGVSSPAPP